MASDLVAFVVPDYIDQLGISYQVGRMSTEMQAEEDQVSQALRRAFHQAASRGEVVLVATVSNACD